MPIVKYQTCMPIVKYPCIQLVNFPTRFRNDKAFCPDPVFNNQKFNI